PRQRALQPTAPSPPPLWSRLCRRPHRNKRTSPPRTTLSGVGLSLPFVRADILALSLDDLVAFSNRGTVKRALKEVTENQVTAQIEETPDGEVTFRWSDGRVSTLPAQHTLREGR